MTRYWCDNSPVWSYYCDASSILFPAWERAFVAVAQHYLPKVTDPDLKARMDEFIKEELAHAKAHESYNKRSDLKKAELAEFRKAAVVHRRPGLRLWLGTMVSIEHIAACMSRSFLKRFSGRTGRDFNLFCWHSKEELGHKSLAIDLWRHLGYSDADLRRIAKTNQVYVFKSLIGYTLKHVYRDGGLKRLGVWKDLTVWGWFVTWKVLIPAMQIYLPSFHPNNHDDSKWVSA